MAITRKTNEPGILPYYYLSVWAYAYGFVWEDTPVDLFMHTLSVPVYAYVFL